MVALPLASTFPWSLLRQESESEQAAAEEEDDDDDDEGRSRDDVKKTLNKMLDKVCGKSKIDEEEDVATILRKPIDFTKSGRSTGATDSSCTEIHGN